MFQDQFSNENNHLEDLKNQIVQHNTTFIWTEFNVDNFENFQQKKQASFDLAKQIESKNKFISEQRSTLENLIETAATDNETVYDKYGNKIRIPAGFKILAHGTQSRYESCSRIYL